MIFDAIVSVAASVSKIKSPFGKRTVGEVRENIKAIVANVNKLDASVDAFPATGATLRQALAIQTLAIKLTLCAKTATNDILNSGLLDEAEVIDIVDKVKVIGPTITRILNNLVAKKKTVEALFSIGGIAAPMVVGLAVKTLSEEYNVSLRGGSARVCTVEKMLICCGKGFTVALLSKAPLDLRPGITAVKAPVDVAFEEAIATYRT
ncbi:hypothetical protein K439DRAFT_367218 [Ramaria rubella]|nr:hypothetical protein K439DRAFT_367218 [Ramaria rubella]